MSRPRVLLYQPLAERQGLPLGLMAVASALDRSRFEPVIIDARFERRPHEALLAALEPDTICVGMSVLTGPPIADARAAARHVKALRPDLPVVWGGWHPSLCPETCLDEPAVDLVVRGQGEQSFAALVLALAEGRSACGIAGCVWRGLDGRPVFEAPRPMATLAQLPPIDYGLVDLERIYAWKGRRQLEMVASQGCHWRCAFCADPQVFGRRWTGLTAAELVERLRAVHARWPFDDLVFQDETFFTHPERAVTMARLLLEDGPRLTWTATLRADQGDRLGDAEMALLARSGLRRLLVGVESGSPAQLRHMRKDLALEQVMLTAERCHRHGIRLDLPFIVGLPDESAEELESSLAWSARLRQMDPGFQTPLFFYRPYPGTALTAALARQGRRLPRSLDEWSRIGLAGAGPWVPRAQRRRAELHGFYLRQAWDELPQRRPGLLRALARWRCGQRQYRLPLAWWLARALRCVDRRRPGGPRFMSTTS